MFYILLFLHGPLHHLKSLRHNTILCSTATPFTRSNVSFLG
jgi:hypothetical protein